MPVFRLSLPGATLSPAIIPSHRSSKFPTSDPVFASGFRSPFKRVSESPLVLGNRCGSLWAVRCGMAGERSDDELYMRRCVEIARKAIGFTSPNPMVGCVIVKDGNVVGQGFHPKAGQPHAEVFALRDAGDLAENATAYVSLEPCNHYGRTPPCTEALIKAKVKRVVVGMVDPNPIVASKGVDKLRNAGIEVTVGVEEEMCKSLNESYIHQMLTGKPLVALRYSLSVNGQIVDQLGEGAADSAGYYSRLLQEYDAVIVSSASIVDNFPVPLSKEPGANQPFLIISASNGNSPIEVPDLPAEAASRSIIFGDKESVVGPISAEKGIEMVIQDKKSLGTILEYAKRRGFCSILMDLRVCTDDAMELLREGFDQNLLRKAVVEVLPVWVESDSEKSLVMFKSLAKTIDMKKLEPKISGKSVLLEGYF